ncbi:MAG: hypothetical protein FJZ90_10440 [Chloroflexi bacterium]|nr:hypothetical protein [Chloroflexota bacterium]
MTAPLSFEALREILIETCEGLPDQRTGKNKRYRVRDAALGAFCAPHWALAAPSSTTCAP